MSSSGNPGRHVNSQPPAEYKFRNRFIPKKPDEVKDLSASVAQKVGRPLIVPQLIPVDLLLPSFSRPTESAIINVARDVVAVNVADTTQDKIPQESTLRTLAATSAWNPDGRSVIKMRH